jgi:hypothetical protein
VQVFLARHFQLLANVEVLTIQEERCFLMLQKLLKNINPQIKFNKINKIKKDGRNITIIKHINVNRADNDLLGFL